MTDIYLRFRRAYYRSYGNAPVGGATTDGLGATALGLGGVVVAGAAAADNACGGTPSDTAAGAAEGGLPRSPSSRSMGSTRASNAVSSSVSQL